MPPNFPCSHGLYATRKDSPTWSPFRAGAEFENGVLVERSERIAA